VQFLGIILLFGGYMLVYSAVAHGGTFATEPWASLYSDAYIGTLTPGEWKLAQQVAPGATPLSPTPPTPLP
jgi:hypothetical protein